MLPPEFWLVNSLKLCFNQLQMKRTLASETPKLVGSQALIQGWVRLRRDHGKLIFLDIRDRSGLLQVVVSPKASEVAYGVAGTLRPEDAVEIEGEVKKRPEGTINKDLASGEVELEAKSLKVLSKAETLPFDMGGEELGLELPTLLDHRSLTLRHPSVASIFKVQEAVVDSFREASRELDCTEIFVPAIASGASEGGAEVFKLDYYGHKAFLTQSPQLYKQMMVPVFERVYTISKAYRAEPSVTTRHLSENTQMDCEFGFVEFDELLNLLEAVSVEMLKKTSGKVKLPNKPLIPVKVPRISLEEAFKLLKKESSPDLSPQDEIDLWEWAKKEHKSDLLIVHHFPTRKRAFYTMPDPKNPDFSLSYDVLFRGLEIASGSQRINDHSQLVQMMKDRGLNPKNFGMYRMAFAYGMPPEGGFSFGLERITMKLMGLGNVREASLYPRDMERVDERLSNQR